MSSRRNVVANAKSLAEDATDTVKQTFNQTASRNHISGAISMVKRTCRPFSDRWATLSLTTRYVLIALSMPFIIFPAVWLLLLGPSLLFIFAVFYSAIYGFSTFVSHFESALREHFNVSDESLKMVHEKADQLKNTAGGVSGKVSGNIVDLFSLIFYTTIMYAMKVLEFVISMSFRQAVIQVGSWTIKAGLWEQTFLPTLELPACVKVESDAKRTFCEHGPDAIYPIVEGQLVNMAELQNLLKYILATSLGLEENLGDVSVLMIIPTNWSRDTRFSLLQMLLKDIGVAGVHLDDSSVMAAFGCAAPSALVVDIGHVTTDITVIIDGEVATGASETVLLGGKDIETHLEHLLEHDGCFLESLAGKEQIYKDNKVEVIRKLKESEACHPVRDQAPPLSFKFQNVEFTIGHDRGNATNVLFHPDLVGKEQAGLAQVIITILSRCDPEKRSLLLEHIILTGLTTRIPLQGVFESNLCRSLPVSEFCGEHQSRTIRFRTVPEYYPEVWQKAGPNASWFGGGITAKCVLNDSRNYFTKEDLIHHGPRIFVNKQV